ncbi:MAG: aldo/keto reductase [Acidimicrobiaceae bacterium]|nr:aldo/keto reductase [Acidimicrobiaceae bacterium]
MNYRTLGSLQVSSVGVGCNNFGGRLDADATNEVVHSALEEGITFFDTADIYGETYSEEFLGRALKGRRAEAVIATKFGVRLDGAGFDASPDYVRSACEDSLRRLDTDFIDLYQVHFPDAATPIDDTLEALAGLVEAGKVREVGCSNFSADQLRDARSAHPTLRFVSLQSQYSLLARYPETDGTLAACGELGMGFLPYYPLANGLLTGKVRPGEPVPEGTRLALMPEDRRAHWLGDQLQQTVGRLLEFVDSLDSISLLECAFSWLLSRPGVTSVIAGASSPAQIRANAAAARELPPEILARLDDLTRPA